MSGTSLPPEDPDQFQIPGEDETPAELSGTVKRGVSLSALGYIGAQALNLIVYMVLARLIAPADFGAYAAATALYGFATLATEGGMMAALIHRRDRIDEAASTATVSTILGGLGLSLVGLAVSPLLGLFFHDSEVTKVAAASAGLVLLGTVGIVPMALLQRRFSFVRRLVIEPVQVVVFGATAIALAVAGLGVWALVVGQYVGLAVDVVLSWALLHWRPRLRQASFAMWRELVAYGRHVLGGTFVLRLGEEADALVIGRFLGTGALGQFRFGFRLSGTPYGALLAGASYVLFPAFARISDDRPRFGSAYLRSLRWICVAAFPAGLILIPLGEPLAVLLFGDKWASAGYAAMGMAGYAAAAAIFSIVAEGLKSVGRPQPLPKMHLVTTVAVIGGMIALHPLGLPAVGAAISLGWTVGAVYAISWAHRMFNISWRDHLREIWAPATAAVVMALALLPLEFAAVHAADRSTAVGLALVVGEGLVAALIYVSILMALSATVRETFIDGARTAIGRAGAYLRRGSSPPIDEAGPRTEGPET
jgi:O-antigen/teichoic acid export membrane protein